MSKEYWIGCDISKKTFWVALAEEGASDPAWSKLPHHEFEHTEDGIEAFLTWLKASGIAREQISGICLEATGRLSWQWAMLLKDRLGPVAIVNPATPKAFAASLGIRDKSDRVDACVCALFGRMRQPEPTSFRSPSRQELCELFRLHQGLDSQRIANEQRLADGPSSKEARAILRRSIDALKREITEVQKAMERVIKADPVLNKDVKQAKTIKGVGKQAAHAILGEYGDLRQYTRNELVALVGIFPKEFTSGTSVHKKAKLAKGGGGRVRRVLYMCAMSARQHNPHMKAFADRLSQNGKEPMEVLGAIMRKLLLMVRAVVISGNPYDPNYGREVDCEVA